MTQADSQQPVPVAIIGMGCLFPMADDLARFWSNIRGRLDAITEVPPTHWRPEDYWDEDPKAADRTYARRGGFLTPVDFPLLDFGIAPHSVEATDTTQLLGLLVARQALHEAGYGSDRAFERDRVSVILGVTGTLELVIPLGARLGHPIWRRALREAGVDAATAEDVVRRIAGSYLGWQENSFPGLLGNVAAGRIANRLDLGGTNCVVDAACASSMGAVNLAMLELSAGRCDLALSGGLDTFNDIFMYMCFSKTPALSPSGDARPFDAAADGTILGEGLGILVLKRLEDARRDGDRVYAVIRSMGTSSDGKGQSVYAPSSAGQVKALRQAYQAAGISPASIELVEAHGTGTKVGDAIELESLEEVYRGARPEARWCALGSIKSQVGHTKAAAGAAGLIKAALALHHKVLPPTIKVREPIESLAAATSPFYLNSQIRPWLPSPGHPRRAAVSAFGFGGSNFHCLLEEADPAMPGIDWGGDVQILAYSDDDRGGLAAALPAWSADVSWPEVRREAARSRSCFRVAHRHRLLLVARRGETDPARLIEEAAARLNEAPGAPRGPRAGGSAESRGVHFGVGPAAGALAMLFPGQGSQYVGMLRDLACRFPALQASLATWDAAEPGDPRLSDRIFPPSVFGEGARRIQDEALRDTATAQPAIGAISAGLFRLLAEFGVTPSMTGGHSFGELTALHAAGRIDEPTLARLAYRRGRLMAESAGASDPGTMLAVLAPVDQVASLTREHGLDVVIANKNAPRQCVLSGPGAEIERAVAILSSAKITCRALAVSAAFHSRFIAEARDAFRRELDAVDVMPATIPVFANATGAAYPEDAEAARDLLADQLTRPVEFVAQVQAMYERGARTFVEVGPDCKLTGLVRAILEGREHRAMALDSSPGPDGEGNLASLVHLLAGLSALGHPVGINRWDDGYQEPPLAAGRKSLTVKVCGANPQPSGVANPPGPGPASPVTADEPRDTIAPTTREAPTPRPVLARETSSLVSLDPSDSIVSERTMNPHTLNNHPTANGHAAKPSGNSHPLRVALPDVSPPSVHADQPTSSPSGLARALEQTQQNLIALQRMAEQTAQLHRQFLEGQAATQRTFQQLLGQQERLTLGALEQQGAPGRPDPLPALAMSVDAPTAPHPVADPCRRGPAATSKAPDLDAAPITAAAPPRVSSGPASPAPPTGEPVGADQSDLVAPVLLEVVAEKTGYPTDMLELDMQLDADLGIDSIKRVEILSALQDRLPGAPPVKPEHIGTLRTLRQIAEFLAESPGRNGSASAYNVPSPGGNGELSHHPAGAVPSATSTIAAVLLEVVAEKTGYPTDMLELDMQLDADLGIDSIKRVEILSALQDRLPGAPPVKPEHIGTLRTLRQIADFLADDADPAPSGGAPRENHAETPDEPPMRLDPAAPLQCSAPRAVARTDPKRGQPVVLAAGSEIWLTDDGSPLTGALRTALMSRGHEVRVIHAGDAELPPPDGKPAGLIVLAPGAGISSGFITGAFRLIRALAPALRGAGTRGGAVLLTVSRLDGAFGLSDSPGSFDPTSGALAGLTKTAAQEWPEVSCKALDLGPDRHPADRVAGWIVEELFQRGPLEVGMGRDPRQIALEPVGLPEPAPNHRSLLGKHDLVVISGGARGITAEVAVALASSFQPHLVLLGRTRAPQPEPDWLAPLQDEAAIRRAIRQHGERECSPQALNDGLKEILAQREIRQTLERIRGAGAGAEYHAIDIRDRAAVQDLLSELGERHGPVRGLIHGAGVLADRRIEDQTDAQFAEVFETKVLGLKALAGSIDLASLRFLALFSSSTARFGRVGQVAYAAANEYLNKWAQRHARRHPECRTVAFNWGPWDGGMVTQPLRAMFEREGLGVIPLASGARLVLEELRSSGPRPVELVVLASPPTGSPAEAGEPRGAEAAGGTMESVFERKVDLGSLPVIRSHVIDGHAVLPMALILEWLAEGALQRHPGMVVRAVENLRLLKGVVLRGHRPAAVTIRAGKRERRGDTFFVPVALSGTLENGREVTHARGEVIVADHHATGKRLLAETDLFPMATDPEEIYRRVLFHGPAMQAIQQIEGCDDLSIAAWVSTSPPPSTWMERPLRQSWLTDPLAIDAAFQLLVLWTQERMGSSSLPTAVGAYHQFRRAFPSEGVRVLAVVRDFNDRRAVADIEFLDGEGNAVARIESYECVIDSSLNQAFRRNRLSQLEVASS